MPSAIDRRPLRPTPAVQGGAGTQAGNSRRPRRARGGALAGATVAVLVLILVVPQGLDYAGVNGMPDSADLLSRVAWLFMLGAGAMLTYRQFPLAKNLARTVNPFLWGFVVLAAASILWSIEPAITTRRIIRLVTILLVCMGFCVTNWRPTRFQDLLRSLVTWILVASVIFVLLDPHDAIHHSRQQELAEAWHGITIGKNLLGSIASGAALLWLHAWLAKQAHPLKAVCGIALAATCLIGSRSATSIMATVFAIPFMLMLMRSPVALRRYMPYLVGVFATLILVYCLAILRLVPGSDLILSPISALTGKDLTFTGRTAIWEILNEHIHWRPWLGTGYGAYWIGRVPTSPSYQMYLRLYFYPSEGHNGYLDVINDLGAVGGFCLLGYFWIYVRQALQLMKVDRYQGALYVSLLFRGFIADMSESHWFEVLSIDFAFMTLATVALASSLLHARMNPSPATSARARAGPPRAHAPHWRPT